MSKRRGLGISTVNVMLNQILHNCEIQMKFITCCLSLGHDILIPNMN